MNLRTVKRPMERVDIRYLSTYGIKAWGVDNLQPQMWLRLIANSPTGTGCLKRYQRFIKGDGVKDEALARAKANRWGETFDDIVKRAAEDVASLGGFALLVNYNAQGKACEVQHLPFEQTRLKEDDDRGYVSAVAVHPDWSGRKSRNGRTLRVSQDTITYYDVFNPLPEVVQAQIAKAGGIDMWRGQVLWVSQDGRNTYPVPVYDSVVTELSTDEALSNIKCRNARNNFLGAGILITTSTQKGEEFDEALRMIQGDENCAKILSVDVAANEQMPQMMQFPTNNYDKEFSVTEGSVIDRIYSAFEQEAWLCIRNGKIGFGGDVMEDAYRYYNDLLRDERALIERGLQRVLDAWHEPMPLIEISPIQFTGKNETPGTATD